MSDFLAWLFGYFAGHSMEEILLVSFLASLIVFVPVPYLIAVAVASNPNTGLDPTAIAIYSSVGAAGGKILVFKASKVGRRLLSEETRARMRPFEKLVSRYGWLAAFIAAATPLPDDLVYVPLGIAGYSLWRVVLATWTGKLILSLLVAWGAHLSFGFVALLMGGVSSPSFLLASGIFTAAATALSVYAVTRVEWNRLLVRWFPWIAEDQ